MRNLVEHEPNKNYKMQTQEELMEPNHNSFGNFSSTNFEYDNAMQNYTSGNRNFERDTTIIVGKMDDLQKQKDYDRQAQFEIRNHNQNHTELIPQKDYQIEHQNKFQNDISKEKDQNSHLPISHLTGDYFSLHSFQHQQLKENKPSQNKHSCHLDMLKFIQKDHEQKLDFPILTKKQIQEQKQHLDELKEKKKEQERKKLVQKMHQQQKQRLQKLRQQTRLFQQMKKQKDKEIMQYKNQLQSLKKNKEKQVMKQKHKEQMHELNVARQKEHQYYKAMMEERQRLAQQLNRKNEEMRLKKLEQEEQLRKEQERQAILNSSSYQKMLREKQQKEEEERKKIDQIKQFLLRRNSYQQKLKNLEIELMKEKSKPVKQKSQMQIKQQERRLNTKSLSAAEIYRMGQEFMEQAHSNINQNIIEQSKVNLSNIYNSLRQSTRTEYKDYLREQKLKREKFFKSTGKLRANPQIRQLKKLIVKQENSPEKLMKAKLLTERFDFKVMKKSSVKLKADCIAAKLKIIEEFS